MYKGDAVGNEREVELKKVYLGDSVYVEIEQGILKLSINNGRGDVDVIYLEKHVLNNLQTYLKSLEEEAE